jgi:ABC-type branched-subunit amino acid transport system substrate-binding protein
VCIVVLTGCSARGATGTPTSSSSGPDITIGISAAQTGYLSASSDLPFISGAKSAVAAINAAGGVNHRKLTIASILDSQSVAATGTSNVSQLINQNHVDVLMSGSDSTACAAVESAVAAATTPMTCISPPPAGSAYQFQVAASVPGMVSDMLSYVKGQKISSVALLATTSVYGQIIAKIINGIAAKMGIKVVTTITVPDSPTDLTATMQQVKAAGAGAVVDTITGPGHITEAKGAAAAGLTIPLVQITDTTNTFRSASEAYNKVYFVTLPPQAYPNIPNAALKAANAAFVPQYTGNKDSIAAAAYGWDAVHILAAAIKKSGAVTGAKLQAALETLTYQGVNSLFTYSASDHSGESTVSNPDSIGHFQNGKLKIVFNASAG